MTTKVHAASAGYISPNDLGYVDLPREAVLNNTVSPSEKRAFATIAAIPLAIPAALFAPEAALLATLVALVGCGSPGEAEDPILTSFGDAGHGEISPDAGTTDEGDGLVATDDGMTDTGDTLVAADDGGMSGPDEGVTIADVVEPQDVENDGDVLLPPEDGVQDLSDASEVKDGADVVDSGDGLNATDDGAPIVDVVIPSDVAPPEDGVQDLSDASEVKDVPDVVNSGDGLVAADDGAAVAEVEVVDPSDVAPPPDGSADQAETAVGTDAAADTAQPCSPSCTPVAETVTCEDGTTNVAVNYFVKCATQFVCDGIGTSLVSVNLPDPTTQTTQSVTVDKCVSDILFGGCQAINDDLSEYCGAVKIVSKPKPGPAPTVKNPTLTQHFPSGDGCFKTGNSYTAGWSASTYNNNPLLCTATLKDVLTNKDVASIQVSQAPSNTMSADIPIANYNILPFRDYALSVFCEDSIGQKGSAASNSILTYYKETLLLYRFMDGSGTKVTDSGPLQLNGSIIGNPQWLVDGGLYFDSKTRISTPKPQFFKSLDVVSLLVAFKPIGPQKYNYSNLIGVSNSPITESWGMDIDPYTKFWIIHNSATAIDVASPQKTDFSGSINYYLGVHQSGMGTSVATQVGTKWQTIASKQDYLGPATSGNNGDIAIGCWNNGLYCYTGNIYQVAIVAKNILNECK